MTNRRGALVLVMALAAGAAACTDRSAGRPGASPPPASTGPAAPSAAGARPASGPVTEADVIEVGHVLRRLDAELDRLESDMAATEGGLE